VFVHSSVNTTTSSARTRSRASLGTSPSGDESGFRLTNVVYDSPFLSTHSLLGLLGVRMTSILFRMHPSHFRAPINSDSRLLPSTPPNQPLCPSPTCLPPVFIMLQQLFELLRRFESVGIVFFCRCYCHLSFLSVEFKTSICPLSASSH
jgi:hypothetical protein